MLGVEEEFLAVLKERMPGFMTEPLPGGAVQGEGKDGLGTVLEGEGEREGGVEVGEELSQASEGNSQSQANGHVRSRSASAMTMSREEDSQAKGKLTKHSKFVRDLIRRVDHQNLASSFINTGIGLGLLWGLDGRLTRIDKYLYSPEDWIKSGALLACGIVNTGVRSECDPTRVLLTDYILQTLTEKCESDVAAMEESFAKYLPLDIGLCYQGKQATTAALVLIPEPFRQTAVTLREICASAGTGSVLKIQQLLHI